MPRRGLGRESGFTFIELLVVTTILLILASAVMPLAKVTVQRQREAELRRSLREMRTAIDRYKEAVDNGLIGSIDVKAGSEGYPPDLDTLVEGVTVANDVQRPETEFLRRVPRDPIMNSTGLGQTVVLRQAGCDDMGWVELYRRVLQVDSQGTGRDEETNGDATARRRSPAYIEHVVQRKRRGSVVIERIGLVHECVPASLCSPSLAVVAARRVHPDRAAHRIALITILATMGIVQDPEFDPEHAEVGPAHGPVPHA